MTNELVKYNAPAALTLGQEQAQAVQEAFAVNVASGVSEWDLSRIKVMSGGMPLWLIPTLEGQETAPRIEGVIVLARDTRVFYQSKDAGSVPPDCSSSDSITGVGKPGGKCADCALAKWGSAIDGGDGQGCKQVKQLFMLRGESMFPEVVSLPPTSAKNARQFFLKLATQGIPYYSALVAIELEKAENAQKKVYGKANLKFLRRLTPEEHARAMEYHAMCQQFAVRVQAAPAEADANG